MNTMNEVMANNDSLNMQNKALINESKELSGFSGGQSIPTPPIISVNNKKQTKVVNIDGEETEVSVLPKAGFNIMRKVDGQYVTNLMLDSDGNRLEEFKAVIIKQRYKISSKYDESGKSEFFYSHEFDQMSDYIELFDKNKNVIFSGRFRPEVQDHYSLDELNSAGKPKKKYKMTIVLYLLMEDEQIYKLEVGGSSMSGWFDYSNSFNNDVVSAYKTKFSLNKENKGTIEYYALEFARGEMVSLAEVIEVQRQLNEYLSAVKAAMSGAPTPNAFPGNDLSLDAPPHDDDEPQDVVENVGMFSEGKQDIDIRNLPF